MKLLLDEDSQGKLPARLLREAGHDVLTVAEANLMAHSDADVLALAIREHRTLITRNVRDFQTLHEAQPDYAGILVEHQDCDASKNLAAVDLVRAVANIEASCWEIAGPFVALNAWTFTSRTQED